MNTGSAFYIGKTHKICEDYASHKMHPQPYILLSDGCSSSPNTDFGSRILNQVAGDMLSLDQEFDPKEFINEAEEIRRLLNLPSGSLDATLSCVYVKDERYYLHMFGDGVTVKTKEDKSMEVVLIEYLSGAPNYLSYNLDPIRKKGYFDLYGLKKKISTYLLEPNGIVTGLVIKEDSEDTFYTENGSCIGYRNISLMSDGVLSFYQLLNSGTSKTEEMIPLNNVLLQLLDFKGFQGEFVDRRLQKFRKDCEKINWFHADDLSLATIYFGKD